MTPRYVAGEVTVPDLTGRTQREAADMLAELGFVINPVGIDGKDGKVIKQDPLPGSKVLSGTSIDVYFE
nr:PASTA domain-containing protein [Sporomusa sphaeroides]